MPDTALSTAFRAAGVVRVVPEPASATNTTRACAASALTPGMRWDSRSMAFCDSVPGIENEFDVGPANVAARRRIRRVPLPTAARRHLGAETRVVRGGTGRLPRRTSRRVRPPGWLASTKLAERLGFWQADRLTMRYGVFHTT